MYRPLLADDCSCAICISDVHVGQEGRFRSSVSLCRIIDDEEGEFLVLVNHERQYSLGPAYLEIPAGWSATGPRGRRQACIDWIDANWTDMRPASLVREMQAHQARDESTAER